MSGICKNCQRVITVGGGLGLCARCYQYNRRNNHLPPSEHMRGDQNSAMLPPVRIDPATLKRAERRAREEGVTLSEWLRRTVRNQS